MRRHQVATAILAALLIAACSSTKDSTELVVTVWSDLSVPAEMDAIRIRVSGKQQMLDHPFQLSTDGRAGTYKIPVQLALVPAGARDLSITISAVGMYQGNSIVSQQAALPFIPGQAHELTLYLARSCKNITCDDSPAFTCENGACTRRVAVNTKTLPIYVSGLTSPAPDAAVHLDPVTADDGKPQGVDAAAVEVWQPLDLPGPDLRQPDALGTCSVENDCTSSPAGPFCLDYRCVQCKDSSNCKNNAGLPLCSPATNTCVSCAALALADGGSSCPATVPVCEVVSGRCVQCLGKGDCTVAGHGFCSAQNQCVGCDSMPAGACSGNTPVCATSGSQAGQCVRCVTNADCGGTTPVCNGSNACVPCTSDNQCTTGPGVCMATQSGEFPQDGRCASDAESFYVQNSASCSSTDANAGTAAKPFCKVQDAISAITAARRVVVIRGPSSLVPFQVSGFASDAPIYAIGRKDGTTGNYPVVSAGASDIGIHLTGGKLHVRGVTVTGAGATALHSGIVVEAGATIGLDRVYVSGCSGGLLVHNGAGFDIANSIFAENQPGVGDFGSFGGVALGSVGAGLVGRFWFNTVVGNQAQGVVCATLSQSLDGVLLWWNTGGDQLHCTLATTSKSGTTDVRDPRLSVSPPYHLTVSSPCRDSIDSSVAHPPDDFDGQGRPSGAKLDCGADEYY